MKAERMMRMALSSVLTLSLVSGWALADGRAKAHEKLAPRPVASLPQSPEQEPTGRPQAPEKVITFTAVGDVMLGSAWPNGGWLPADDGASLLSEVAPILSASDITFGNLEGPMVDEGTSMKCPEASPRCYAFRVPTRYGKYLKEAGFDVMSLANNHALDFGVEGRQSSKRVLDALGIAHSGEVGDIAHLVVNGKKIALIAFTTYDTSYNLNKLDTARKLVTDLAARADLVIVSFHGGAEGANYQHVPYTSELFLGENRGNLRQFTHAMIDAGAALVIGHGPHVVRGMEVYRGHLIAYSLGNFATYGSFNLSGPQGLSLILQVRLAMDGKFLGGRIYPVKQERPGGPHLDANRSIIPILSQLSQQDFGTSALRINPDGEISPPAEMVPLAKEK
jgi:poly-gamma-glutamate capsule biosynthesis protein CapA/YwtB (metallophosphatase superfamily)